MQQVNNWDQWKRMQVNVDKAQYNPEVNRLLNKHYQQLHTMLVKSEADEDIFNDTYLKLTYNYNPDSDFIQQYQYYFNLLKGAYYRDNIVSSYLVVPIDERDFPDTDSEELITNSTNADFIETIKAEIQNI